MFEGNGSHHILGAALDAQQNARDNAAAARRANEIGRKWKEHAQGLETRIAELELKLAQETAHAGGYKAQLDAYKKEAPRSPLLADSGVRFKDGDVKTVGRLIYEREFDRIAREDFGIAKPEELRAD